MLRIVALIFILYGVAQLFMRSYRLSVTNPGPLSTPSRIARLRAVLPAYLIVAAGAIMLIASFAR